MDKHAIAKIEAGPVNEPRSQGTGFLVAEKLVLAAFHVVADRPAALRLGNVLPLGEITLTFPAGKAKATIHHGRRNHVADFALLEIEWLDGATPPAPLPLGLADDLRADPAWETFGFPEQNPEGMVNNGTFSDTHAVHQKTDAFQLFYFQVVAGRGELVRGFSGAPVIASAEQNRAVVGILRSALMHNNDDAAAGTVYACPMASVLAKAEDVAEKRLPHPDPCFGLAELRQDDNTWWTFGFPEFQPDGVKSKGEVRDWNAGLGGAPALQLYCVEAAAGKGAPVRGYSGSPVLIGEDKNSAVVGVLRAVILTGTEGRSEAGTLYACPVSRIWESVEKAVPGLLPKPALLEISKPGAPHQLPPERDVQALSFSRPDASSAKSRIVPHWLKLCWPAPIFFTASTAPPRQSRMPRKCYRYSRISAITLGLKKSRMVSGGGPSS